MPDSSKESPVRSDPAFLDDFYAECDEHLIAVRRLLVRLEASPAEPLAHREAWESLLRHVHSLKGVLGLAGLEAPERLVHASEDLLRSLSSAATPLEGDTLRRLERALDTLAHALAAHRQQLPLPDLALAMDQLSMATGEGQPAPHPAAEASRGAPPELQAHVQRARQAGKRLWRVEFTPSAELNQRGVNVSEVRARLQGVGELVRSAPQVKPHGGIAFEFLVATEQDLGRVAPWRADGLVVGLAAAETEAGGSDITAPIEAGRPDLSAPAYVAPSHFVRVDLGRLDELMQTMGELVVARARFEETLGQVTRLLPPGEKRALQEISETFGKELRRLRERLMRLRLVSLGEVFERMSLVVRDMARESGRKIRLTIEGQETQIDKYIVERIKDPLLHLVRNAAIHGLDSPAARAAGAKPEALTIALRASTVGESVLLEVEDDGQGMIEERIRARAAEKGLSVPEALLPATLLELICRPGFSTRDRPDLGAGRGVGMAVVKNTVSELGGELGLRTTPGRGTTFSLRLPLTVAITDALLIAVGGQKFALPQASLREVITVPVRAIQRLKATEFVSYRQGILPLVRLAQVFHLPPGEQATFPVLVISYGAERLGLVADRLLGQREIMVRSLNDPLLKNPVVSGATELGDGRAVLILDTVGLLRAARLAA